ncbi:putative FAD-linked oxidase [Gordonia araii NBRC 100433]|uniref:Putative FAD-linked oxidase n=1 Tax=Gordonia araii NBRC 100433 TaxID=1073574 RepID=G7H2B1_9ACTN|nr:FAD-binding oxidoreductase [Gordonia araii]NNG97525.1 FAD-binding oxidoreductase [Gordonia araii NBRC 100433]GAB09986.1 putative FAD-linked oxidase [Gordonia araii NBRC 100433]
MVSDPDLSALATIVGDAHVLTDTDVIAGYVTDWTGRRVGHAEAVVRPRTTDEVAGALTVCAASGIAVVPQGGNTGLVGGSVPAPAASQAGPTVVVSTARMTDIGAVDPVEMSVGVQAGATIAAIQGAATAAGLHFGIDLASRDSATAGGIVATNAGGVHVVRHGTTRANVLGVEAVLADGRILRRWRPLRKDNVGYDLPGLLVGSEGTLAVVTGVLFALADRPLATAVAMIGVERVDEVFGVVGAVRRAGLTVEAAELMTRAGVDLVVDAGARPALASSPAFQTLVEVSGADPQQRLAEVLDDIGVADAVVAEGPAQALWELRERHTETIAAVSATVPVKLDISVPRRCLGEFLDELDELAESQPYRCRPIVFGHVADGNLHVNLLDVPADEQAALTDRVLESVVARGGSVSAEHGVGRDKRDWLAKVRDAPDVEMMAAIKRAWDPDGRLNPGVLFPAD